MGGGGAGVGESRGRAAREVGSKELPAGPHTKLAASMRAPDSRRVGVGEEQAARLSKREESVWNNRGS